MKRSDKKNLVQNLKDELDSSTSVIVTHYSGLTVNESEELRSEMRDNGAKFKVTKNRLTKLALEQTQFKDLADLFTGPTAIAYSDDPVAPAKVAVSFEKKLENFKIIGGGYNGEKIDLEKINFLATLPSMDELRGKILGIISAPAQKIALIMKEPAGQIARLVSAQSKSLEESN
ncbi:MAG: 50S ribosomal protein L10 [Pelagibacteraceae bacterium]|nr:50S ribosomal protein L10 [Pelagibacteraceae bacterium]MBT5214896.1 50S ribosomal protein L10 [Pelagibacteraceae bacterium]MBT6353903.1 50S ribosomal protein L10 [Pelagibacteraceae bacterium]